MADKPDRPKQLGLKVSERIDAQLETLAAAWHTSRTNVIEHAIAMLADDEISGTLGNQFQAAEQGLRCWSELIERASADNDRMFSRGEWNLLADANNGCSPVFYCAAGQSMSMPLTMLWANVADAHKLDGAGEKWLGKGADKKVADLCDKLRSLDFVHSWAVVLAVQFFWADAAADRQRINHQKDEWWTLAFRKSHLGSNANG